MRSLSSVFSTVTARRRAEAGDELAVALLMGLCVGGITLAITLPISMAAGDATAVEEMKATVEATVTSLADEYPDLGEDLQAGEGPSRTELAVLPLNLEGEKGDSYEVVVEVSEAGFWTVQGVHDSGKAYSFDSRVGQFLEG